MTYAKSIRFIEGGKVCMDRDVRSMLEHSVGACSLFQES